MNGDKEKYEMVYNMMMHLFQKYLDKSPFLNLYKGIVGD